MKIMEKEQLINKDTLEGLLSIGLEVNHWFLLHLYSQKSILEPNLTILSWRQKLIRKGFLSNENEITESGQMILDGKYEKQDVRRVRREIGDKNKGAFDEWWEAYPNSTGFIYKGRRFIGSQNRRVKKDACAALFQEIISKGEFTAPQIIQGTVNQIIQAKEDSLKRGSSQINYIPNSERYLRERAFAGFIHMELEDETKMVNTNDLFNG